MQEESKKERTEERKKERKKERKEERKKERKKKKERNTLMLKYQYSEFMNTAYTKVVLTNIKRTKW